MTPLIKYKKIIQFIENYFYLSFTIISSIALIN